MLAGHQYQEKVALQGSEGKQLITDMRIAAEQVLNGQAEGKQAFTVRNGQSVELRQLNVGLAGLWYNPKNLHIALAALGLLQVKTADGQPLFLKPSFSSLQTNYSAALSPQITEVEVIATAYWPDRAELSINGVAGQAGQDAQGGTGPQG